MLKLLAIAAAGAAGTLTRYALAGWVQRAAGTGFPWGTLAVNAAGCFLFGVVWSAAQERGLIGPEMRTILLVGFMGAFTTYSTFAAESGQLFSDRELLMGAANVAVQVVGGVALFFLGQALGRVL